MRCKDVASLLAPEKSMMMSYIQLNVKGTRRAGVVTLPMQNWASPPTEYSKHVSMYLTSTCSQIQYELKLENVCGALHIDSCT